MAYTIQSARVPRVQIETTFVNGSGTASSVKADAFLQAVLINDAQPSDVRGLEKWTRVSYDLIQPPVSTTNYTAAGVTANGVQIAALMRAMALSEATRQSIAP